MPKPFDLFEPGLYSIEDETLVGTASALVHSPLFCFALVVAATRGTPRTDGGIDVKLLAHAQGAQIPELLRFIAQQIREQTAPQLEARADAIEREEREKTNG